MSQLTSTNLLRVGDLGVKVRVREALGSFVFASLVLLLPLTAIPYGSVEPWWKAFFICAILVLTIVWLIDGLRSGCWLNDGSALLAPLAALIFFSLVQTISFWGSGATPGAIHGPVWNAISADPFQTRFFASQLLGLTLAAALLFRYLSSESRMRLLVNAIIAVAAASAVFGILRQASQRSLGFALPLLATNQGYAQFVNKNHFAYLMEMGLGLTLGFVLAGAVKREQILIYAAGLLSMWSALGLSGSRGGLISMMAQVVMAALVLSFVREDSRDAAKPARVRGFAQKLPTRLALIVLLVAAVVIGTLWLGGDPLASKIEHSGNDLSASSIGREGVGRNEIWRTTLKMFAAHPLAGVGMGAYWVAVPQFHDASGRYTPQEAHNDYLELLASGGIIGAGIGVWFVLVALRRARRNLRSPNRVRRAACLGGIIGMTGVAVHSLLDFGLHSTANAFMFTTLIVLATSNPGWANQVVNEKS